MSFSFGAPASGTPTSSGAPAGGSLFGTAGSTFGSNQTASTTPSSTGGALFGNVGAASGTGTASPMFGAQPNSQPNAMFGSTATPAKPATSTTTGTSGGTNSLFGAGAGAGSGGSLFGNPAASTTPGPSGPALFGNASTTPSAPALFGNASATPSAPALFGNKSTTPSAPSMFGNASTTPAGPPPGSKLPSLFGNANSATPATAPPATTAASAPKPLFGTAAGATQSTTPSFSLPSSTGANPAAAKPAFPSLGGASNNPTGANSPASSPAFPSLGTLGGGSSTTPLGAAKPSFPSLGGASIATTGAAASPATTTPSAPKSLFGSAVSSTPNATPSFLTPSTGATPAAAKPAFPSLGGQSTTGPAPPAQSRLKNKTMDEIITRWATDLTKYQKDFREQAEKVAEWDRLLVENASKVQKLYGSTVDAERATQEVERQLASVEGQQDELSSWLDRYEREVDEMMTKQQVSPGDALQGPDQERERTYKLAENLNERLDEMGKDLTSMIEEVNGASATLSKTNRADEPISQIVRILNSHLSQLQVIDQGTSELQVKVAAVQKAGQSISSRLGYGYTSPGVGGGNAADDFYRSYMGRR
ncbi:hypothetical protein N7495_008378 [Penicillium taxi]|uniref:uncharacterized protein n=1 Tax=Penicillium taxi TaxID=168475 RepID=UPI00254574C9|nr:uncharacterized protein N7495_008378 [Penicillium taxi]KAJ5888337.1 hypothetical protein N7495_008378 [Penicillium taxi]